MTEDSGRFRILVADDNVDAADSLAMLLQLAGQDVVVANDGLAALSRAAEFRPALAFIDISMPRLDGYGVAEALRREDWGRSIYLVALTGWSQPANRRRAIEAGFDRHVPKPMGLPVLQAVLRELASRR